MQEQGGQGREQPTQAELDEVDSVNRWHRANQVFVRDMQRDGQRERERELSIAKRHIDLAHDSMLRAARLHR